MQVRVSVHISGTQIVFVTNCGPQGAAVTGPQAVHPQSPAAIPPSQTPRTIDRTDATPSDFITISLFAGIK